MIWDLLFPKYCLECKKQGKYVCSNCLSKVPSGGWSGTNYAVFKYEGVIRKAILALKYKFATDVADELAEAVIGELKKNNTFTNSNNLILIPIPIHWKRLNWRGFNQSKIIGEKIALKMNWKFMPDLLIKKKQTKAQAELKGNGRMNNLKDAFLFNQKYGGLKKEQIIVFDDVYTTGSTINESKRILENAGFDSIDSLTLAR